MKNVSLQFTSPPNTEPLPAVPYVLAVYLFHHFKWLWHDGWPKSDNGDQCPGSTVTAAKGSQDQGITILSFIIWGAGRGKVDLYNLFIPLSQIRG